MIDRLVTMPTGQARCVVCHTTFVSLIFAFVRWRRAVPLCTEMREFRIGNSQFAQFADIYPLYTHTKGQELLVLLPTHTRVCEALQEGWEVLYSFDPPFRSLHVKKSGPPVSPQGAKK
eukprot:6181242-Prymnesium_polylepis.1